MELTNTEKKVFANRINQTNGHTNLNEIQNYSVKLHKMLSNLDMDNLPEKTKKILKTIGMGLAVGGSVTVLATLLPAWFIAILAVGGITTQMAETISKEIGNEDNYQVNNMIKKDWENIPTESPENIPTESPNSEPTEIKPRLM